MEALGAQPAAAAVKEVKWAKGLTLNSRGDLWNMAFQIRGKRHAFSLRCSQAEAAVAFDLGCYWAHAAKGNNPEGSTRYNFGVAWFPRTLLAELLALPDWTAVKASLTHMLSLGMLRQLVPFEGAARRYSVAPADGGRSQSGLEIGWTCVPADDVHSFGSRGPLVQLTYTPPPTGGPGRPKPATTVVLSCDTAAAAAELYSQLQEAAALRTEAGLPAAQDLGAAFALPLGGNLLGSSVQARPGRAGVAAAARADLLLSQEEGQAGEDDSPACSTQDSAAAAAAELDDDPSLEELALFTEFAELARSASGSGSSTHGSGCGAASGQGAAGGCPALDVKQEPAIEEAATVKPELEKVEAQPESPLGVAPKSPAARPEADLAAASSRSSMDGGCSSVGLDAAVQRQGTLHSPVGRPDSFRQLRLDVAEGMAATAAAAAAAAAVDATRSQLADFTILKELGRGTFGAVLLARRAQDGQLYALKQVQLSNRSAREQLEAVREAQLLASLDSPYITKYYDSFLHEGCLYICMEYAPGGRRAGPQLPVVEAVHTCCLHAAIRATPRPLPEEAIWRVLLHITLALHHMHARQAGPARIILRTLHRDIKTLNIFLGGPLDQPGQLPAIKLGDVGVSKVLDEGRNHASTFLGTPLYLSPEMCNELPYDSKSDIWALGVVLYECAMRRHPFEAKSQPSLILKILRGRFDPVLGLSAELTSIINRCLSQARHLC
ncbi:hypothetical protein COHA_002620 [Chlorella ohadii]|uniref:non-specific serine/threonine protein kinase n=1 Tax=Chlorella ohadii TaxID=2649997 RepID=A0AAD5DSW2_9CHLO|nr:hypothetical protein COHA_002620 [Chlorella ohadii]